ncbi:hypothetical protein AB0N09_34695 [Streptomyces erythrochromogenes]
MNPYGRFELDMTSYLDLAATASMVSDPRTVPDTGALRPVPGGAAGAMS